MIRFTLVVVSLCLATSDAIAQLAPRPESGMTLRAASGAQLRILVDAAAGVGPLEMVELVLPPSPGGGGEHRHQSAEVLYVLEGELDHVVNDSVVRLATGDAGIVRVGDRVRHRVVGDQPVRLLIIWSPAGELDRVRGAFTESVAAAAAPIEALEALRAAWIDGYERGDVVPLENLYTEGATRMPHNGASQEGRAAILDAYARSFANRALDPEITLVPDEVHVRSGEILERGRYRELLTVRATGAVLLEEGKYVSVVRRGADGHWRYHWSIFNADAPAAPNPTRPPSPPRRPPGARRSKRHR
jgi:ketosteroid isomerase-like protein/quercetin dioxygenase-like cupin family protein